MTLQLGVKSDPVEYRYTFDWLFALMRSLGLHYLQLGTFFEMYGLSDAYFLELRDLAKSYDVVIKSVFTTHRELGGFFTGNGHMERVARSNFERLIAIAGVLGAGYVGSNPGSVPRDRISLKNSGIRTYLKHMKELQHIAKACGLEALTMEPMSSSAEPPAYPLEIEQMCRELGEYHQGNQSSTVPVYLCGDIAHGIADRDRRVIHSNEELFEFCIPWMCEFHFKNTDAVFESTFGFSEPESKRGVVNLRQLDRIMTKHADDWPVSEVVGYLEMGGPKLGREYSDHLLEGQLRASIAGIREGITFGSKTR
ncbi:MAG TPA: TIM barrel protein [Spirochaetia bacterium]|nr:TIM barrel protein [Spirochaetia bacterium]